MNKRKKIVSKKPGRKPLNEGKFVAARTKGATIAGAAKAAGSTAATRRGLHEVGRKIEKRLIERGEIVAAFESAGYSLQRFAEQVVQQTEAEKKFALPLGEGMYEHVTGPDWDARSKARQQYMQAVGMTRLPLETDPPPGAMEAIPNDQLVAMLAVYGAAAAVSGGAAGRG